MRRLLAYILILIVIHGVSASKHVFESETLNYKVMFKWGLINKKAGTATLTLSRTPLFYSSQLTAQSEPWADRIYKVRDTLNGQMRLNDFTPIFYEKIANEGNERKHDVVRYDYTTANVVKAKCTRKVYKKGELKIDDARELEAEGETVDMLTSFYYMRGLPYESWNPGEQLVLNIFSGKRKEILRISYLGKSKLDIDGKEMEAFHISFTFSSNGGKKTSDDMEAWISSNDNRIPLKLEGRLPVGKVHCIYTGSGDNPVKK